MIGTASRWAVLAAMATLVAACGNNDDGSFQGYVEGEYLYLAAPLGGYLSTLDAARGSRVAAGAPVFSIAADPEQQGLQEADARAAAAREKLRNLAEPRRQPEIAAAQAQLRAAEAALRLAETQLRQQEALAAKGFVSQARLDEARSARDRDAAQVEAARQQLATARITKQLRALSSSFRGRAAEPGIQRLGLRPTAAIHRTFWLRRVVGLMWSST